MFDENKDVHVCFTWYISLARVSQPTPLQNDYYYVLLCHKWPFATFWSHIHFTSQFTNFPMHQLQKKGNTQALLSISLKAIPLSLAVWYASNCGEQRGKKRPRDDKENRSTSFSRGMYFLNANMNKTFGEKNRRNALSSWRKNLSKQPTHLKWSALRPHQATFNWIKFSHDLGELLIFSDLKA